MADGGSKGAGERGSEQENMEITYTGLGPEKKLYEQLPGDGEGVRVTKHEHTEYAWIGRLCGRSKRLPPTGVLPSSGLSHARLRRKAAGYWSAARTQVQSSGMIKEKSHHETVPQTRRHRR